MLVCIDESERKWRESIQVEGLQGVNFSRDVVVGGEEKASQMYLEDIWSANSCPLIFGASDRWCSNKVVVPPAYSERESVTWGYDEGYFERERYGDRKIELFVVGRSYTELKERVKRERDDDYTEFLPYDIIGTAVDDDNDDFITYLVVTDDTKGDMTILNRDQLYEIMICNNHINYNSIVEEYDNVDNHYVDNNNMMYLIKNDVYRPKIRLLYDDGG